MSAYSHRSSLAAYQSVAAHGGVAAADPHRLIAMLMDGALDRIAAARGAIESGDIACRSRMIHRTVQIVSELRGSLNFDQGGQIAANLGDLYDYAIRQLLRANLEGSAEHLDEVSRLLRQLRGAWLAIPTAVPTEPALR